MVNPAVSSILLLCLAQAPGRTADAPARLRVLLLSGQNNHDWRATTPVLKAILEDSARFIVDVSERPDQLTAATLAPYDLILSNWNAFPADAAVKTWPEATRQAYLDFVRGGRGHVVVHAGSSSFADWGEYQQLCLATWKMGQTGHGPIHTFPVRMEAADHPITHGLAGFETRDELWRRPGLQPDAAVLASSFSDAAQGGTGQWEPTALVGTFGQGRTFTLLLGHDAAAMQNAGFAALLTRGTEWAATGKVTLPVNSPWAEEPGKSATRLGPHGVLWRFDYAAEQTKPYFDPLCLPTGQNLTWVSPPDHPWHYGLWFSWKLINGVNYWEEDPNTRLPAGRTSWSNVEVERHDDGSAVISLDVSYHLPDAPPILTERRTIAVSAPDQAGAYRLDWTATFTAAEDVTLDRTPPPDQPDGVAWGGYGGLSYRAAKAMTDVLIRDSEGRSDDATHRQTATWLDLSGTVGGKAGGVTIFDHPTNPRHPTPWFIIRNELPTGPFWYSNPAILCRTPLTLERGGTLRLRYRVLVHPGRPEPGALKAEWERFAAE